MDVRMGGRISNSLGIGAADAAPCCHARESRLST